MDLVTLSQRHREHGLRTEDYNAYQKYCSRRLGTIRGGLKKASLAVPSVSKEAVESDSLVEISDNRQLEFLFVACERSWARAMALRDPPKREEGIDPSIADIRARHRHHQQVRKLRKACRIASLFQRYTAARDDPAMTALAVGYGYYLNGLALVEAQEFPKAHVALMKHIAIFGTETTPGVLSPHVPPDREFKPLVEVSRRYAADGLRRFCRYQIAGQLQDSGVVADIDGTLDAIEKKAVKASEDEVAPLITALQAESKRVDVDTVRYTTIEDIKPGRTPKDVGLIVPAPSFFDIAFERLTERSLHDRIAAEKAKSRKETGKETKPAVEKKAEATEEPATEEVTAEEGGIKGWFGRWRKK
ncbi:signal recognition particle subunit [Carpediemonas membranifera]|uniref:Signal recognition particle subunit SRP68 n=1 Tax=Carpediemonas membranifera TaxID=201153 RepID=A0A8J6AXX1_9EUKA|nr:signal recognition particle subunit [Carpediemonas membranifera]|eukprot:KAG9396838.1 signal recognition particle subunit [Carpediemonas membranifera]